jgi:hypothetical protein
MFGREQREENERLVRALVLLSETLRKQAETIDRLTRQPTGHHYPATVGITFRPS